MQGQVSRWSFSSLATVKKWEAHQLCAQWKLHATGTQTFPPSPADPGTEPGFMRHKCQFSLSRADALRVPRFLLEESTIAQKSKEPSSCQKIHGTLCQVQSRRHHRVGECLVSCSYLMALIFCHSPCSPSLFNPGELFPFQTHGLRQVLLYFTTPSLSWGTQNL